MMDDKSEAKTKKLSIHMHVYSFLMDYSDKIFSLNLNQKVNYLWKDKIIWSEKQIKKQDFHSDIS